MYICTYFRLLHNEIAERRYRHLAILNCILKARVQIPIRRLAMLIEIFPVFYSFPPVKCTGNTLGHDVSFYILSNSFLINHFAIYRNIQSKLRTASLHKP